MSSRGAAAPKKGSTKTRGRSAGAAERQCDERSAAPTRACPIRLGVVESRTVHMGFPDKTGHKLYGVPLFLIDAFNLLRLRGLHTEGLFRREGNAMRVKLLWAPFHGRLGLPEACTAHDICCLVKRFLRELHVPLLADVQAQFVQFAASIQHPATRLKSVLELCHVLPRAHLGTLAFLCKQLQQVAAQSESNRMDAAALATVLAPTVFRQSAPLDHAAGDARQLAVVRQDLRVKAQLIQLLIENADHIGAVSDWDKVMSPTLYRRLLPEDRSTDDDDDEQPPVKSATTPLVSSKPPAVVNRGLRAVEGATSRRSRSLKPVQIKVEEGVEKCRPRRYQTTVVATVHKQQTDEAESVAKGSRRSAGRSAIGGCLGLTGAAPSRRPLDDAARRLPRVRRPPPPPPPPVEPTPTFTFDYDSPRPTARDRTRRATTTALNHWQWASPADEAGALSVRAVAHSPLGKRALKESVVSVDDYELRDRYLRASPAKRVDRRRRFTTPTRRHLLRRNQPNTLAAGLKMPAGRSTEDLSSLAGDDDEAGGEAAADEKPPAFDAEALLEERGLLARARRERARCRLRPTAEPEETVEMASPPAEESSVDHANSHQQLMDDLERELAIASPLSMARLDEPAATRISTPIAQTAVEAVASRSHTLNEENLANLAIGDASSEAPIGNEDEKADVGGAAEADAMGSAEAEPKPAECAAVAADEEFAESAARRAAILRQTDKDAPPSTLVEQHDAAGMRPSIAFIARNRRGLVQQRVARFDVAPPPPPSTTVRKRSGADGDVFKLPALPPRKPKLASSSSYAGSPGAGRSLKPKPLKQLKRLDSGRSPKSPLGGVRADVRRRVVYPKSPRSPLGQRVANRRSLSMAPEQRFFGTAPL